MSYNPFALEEDGVNYTGHTGGLSSGTSTSTVGEGDNAWDIDTYSYGADPTFGYGVSGVNVGDYGPLHTLSGDDLVDAIATLGFSQFEGNENYQTAIDEFKEEFSGSLWSTGFDDSGLKNIEDEYAMDMDHQWNLYDTWTQSSIGEDGSVLAGLEGLQSTFDSDIEGIEMDKRSKLESSRLARRQQLQEGFNNLKSAQLSAGRGIAGGKGSLALKNLQSELGLALRENTMASRTIKSDAAEGIQKRTTTFDANRATMQTAFSDDLDLKNIDLDFYLSGLEADFEADVLAEYSGWYNNLISSMENITGEYGGLDFLPFDRVEPSSTEPSSTDYSGYETEDMGGGGHSFGKQFGSDQVDEDDFWNSITQAN